MSQNLGYHNTVLEKLVTYSKAILNGETGQNLYPQYKDVIQLVAPKDVITIVDELVKTNTDIAQVKRTVNKILNIFYEPIKRHGKFKAAEGTFLFYLMEENRAMEMKLQSLKEYTKKVFAQKDKNTSLLAYREAILDILLGLNGYEKHFLKIENILFPYFEKAIEDFRCVSVMWAMHDDTRKCLGRLIQILVSENPSVSQFNFEIGRLYFSVLPVIFREEYILFPECQKIIEEKAWKEMMAQSHEIGFAFVKTPEVAVQKDQNSNSDTNSSLIDLETGSLEAGRIINLFNHLPVDITYIDENDEVRFFSNPRDRFFIRSKAIIGRKVQNCHPPDSIGTVNQIIESFRSGKKDSESFWINAKGKFILIQYFAVRGANGSYQGTVEVSQNITEIKKLEGEKRIVDV